MTELGAAEVLTFSMTVMGYSVEYERSTNASEPSKLPVSSVQVMMSVKGATVEHHQNRPISRVEILFLEGEFEASRVGFLNADPAERDIMLHARLPLADFAGFWAALRLDQNARLRCRTQRDDVFQLVLLSKGSLLPV